MKSYKIFSFLCLLFAITINISADTWNYDFGTGTGSFITAGQSTTFLPAPPSGTARVRVGTAGGSINMDNPGLAGLGTNTELRIVAPTSTQYNKFAIYDYTASQTFQIKFSMLMGSSTGGNVDSGSFYFFTGDGDRFSGNSGFSDDQTFAALQMILGSGGTVNLRYRRTGAWVTISSTPVAQSILLDFEIYGNNTASTINYTYGGNSQSIAANTFDLWINGSLYGDDLVKDRLADTANIDSFMFYGESSVGNVANLFIDDITYQNTIDSDEILPIELTSFTATTTQQDLVRLDWITQSESGVCGYYIYRNSIDTLPTANAVSPLISPTNTSSEHAYTFTDTEVENGTWYYWLQNLSLNGETQFHGPISIELNKEDDEDNPDIPEDQQSVGLQSVFPNPFNPSTSIAFYLESDHWVDIDVFNTKGQKVRSLESLYVNSGSHVTTWDGMDNNGKSVSSGVYTVRMIAGQSCTTKRVVLLK
ncbi:MAG: T9SS type A sorting domain-containing protein [Candidatus Cloacimonetes bacterium]|nr:T9SS type A sorting domain-containing protein [Candidatus Cloacimonadota bacterium]